MAPLQQQQRELILHSLDRLQPGSKLGGPLHPERERLNGLRSRTGLSFQFYGNQDMFGLGNLYQAGKLAPRYTITTCWAPATPTFAYEPTRFPIRSSLKSSSNQRHRSDKPSFPANGPWRSCMETAHSSFRHGSSRFEVPLPCSICWRAEASSVSSAPSIPRSSGKSWHNYSTTPVIGRTISYSRQTISRRSLERSFSG